MPYTNLRITPSFPSEFFWNTLVIILCITVSGCNPKGEHWEQITTFRDSGSFVVLPADEKIEWTELLNDSSVWMPASKADTTSIRAEDQVIGKLEFTLNDIDGLFGGLLQTRNGFVFQAYLNGHHLISRQQNEFVPDYRDPWGNSETPFIYASFRLTNLIIEQQTLRNLKPGNNVLLIVYERGKKKRLQDLRNEIIATLKDKK